MSTFAFALVCLACFCADVVVGIELCAWRIRRATRKLGEVAKASQLDTTGVHRVPPAPPPPHERTRAKPDEDGQH